ncbi:MULTISPECIES: amidohydrolase family protein [unclassified Arthrobacter]|uniref:amidohydrolase family protein n=1 Tax=unclassified Arthrobacter TaxID=235627 RepID=UPI002E01775D|nr:MULTISPECIES: amidohydrolase family protein [unclassified Arthrobacter]MEC5191453.1 putative TIM-barrel fold metal-dependent hydrolase [Arthrobacter sp. MP_M4]MEC5203036.1 putative TIM-barrel fold metal-dependent hydrolase [Arthrobacter sp. MP_M7]
MSGPYRIDTHQHIVPPGYARWMHEMGIRPGGVDLPPWSERLALKFMDKHGVQTGILSLSTPGVYFGDAAETRRWAREVNEFSAEVVAARPERFGFFATLTLPDVEGALAEARYALDALHADGIVLLANNDGRYLGDPDFEPLLAFLHHRRAVVFVHPGELPAPGVPGVPAFAADFLLDTTRTALSLILAGAMEKYPGIRFILAHAGGFVPFIAYRILLAMLTTKDLALSALAALTDKNQSVLRRFYYDVALSATPSALPSLLEVADPGRITYGTDFPFAPPAAVDFLTAQYESYPLELSLRAGIDRGNAEALFPRLGGR